MTSNADLAQLAKQVFDPSNPPLDDRIFHCAGDFVSDTSKECKPCTKSQDACQMIDGKGKPCFHCLAARRGKNCEWTGPMPSTTDYRPVPPGQPIARPKSKDGIALWEKEGRLRMWLGPGRDPVRVAVTSGGGGTSGGTGGGGKGGGTTGGKGRKRSADDDSSAASPKRRRTTKSPTDLAYTGGGAGGGGAVVATKGRRKSASGKDYHEFSPAEADAELRMLNDGDDEEEDEEEEDEEEVDELAESDGETGETGAEALKRYLASSAIDKSKIPAPAPFDDPFDLDELFDTGATEHDSPPSLEHDDSHARKKTEATASTSTAEPEPHANNRDVASTTLWSAFNVITHLEADAAGKVELGKVIRIIGPAIKTALEEM